MCQPVTGPKFTFKKPRKMWKAVRRRIKYSKGSNVSAGPFHATKFRLDGWAEPKSPVRLQGYTQAGYHVFASRKGAEAYADGWSDLDIIPVYVKGRALPFIYIDRKRYKGYAVQSWRKA